MSKAKRILAMLLALTLCLSLTVTAFADNNQEEAAYEEYTSVFVHGLFGWGQYDGLNDVLPYWGMTSGNMMWYLSAKGYDVVAASVGPISSCWDRCCELFAQLTGTRTDYGEAHTAEENAEFADRGIDITHQRYGRNYSGNALVQGWGPVYDETGNATGEWYDSKLNLIGHSFGGPTCVMFLQLLAEGDEAERSYAQETYGDNWKAHCSPLFWGDYEGENLINSVTSLAGVLNGTTFIDSCDDSTELMTSMAVAAANLVGETNFNELYDFQLEQFGITKSDNPSYEYILDVIRSTRFLDSTDNAIYDLSIKGCNVLKSGWECYDNVYYFAYPGCATYCGSTGTQLPNANIWPVFIPFATFMGAYVNYDEVVTDIHGDTFTVVDENWLPNDGMVNTISASYVFGCEQKEQDGVVEPGIWITMPTYGYDHMDFCGAMLDVTQNSWQTCAFFDEIMNNISATYQPVQKLEAPVLTAAKIKRSRLVKLSWDEVEGATVYNLYRASSPDGAYSLIRSVPYTCVIDISTVAGRTYYYRITAADRDDTSVTSSYSDVVSVKVTLK